MTPEQFEILTELLGPKRKQAAHAVLFDNATDADAERLAHGDKTNTVRRDINTLKGALSRAERLFDVKTVKVDALESVASDIVDRLDHCPRGHKHHEGLRAAVDTVVSAVDLILETRP